MLCLTRKVGERLVIGDNIVLTVDRMKGGQVRLAIAAPRDVKVLRWELIRDEKIKQELMDKYGLNETETPFPE